MYDRCNIQQTQIAKFMGPTWGPPGSCRPQMDSILATWTLLSGKPLFLTQRGTYASVYHAIIGSYNGVLPLGRQTIIWTNARSLIIGPSATNFSEILIKIKQFHTWKYHQNPETCRHFVTRFRDYLLNWFWVCKYVIALYWYSASLNLYKGLVSNLWHTFISTTDDPVIRWLHYQETSKVWMAIKCCKYTTYYDNPRYCQWLQSWHHDNSRFSV